MQGTATDCAYCAAYPNRVALADALDSGRYAQQPRAQRNCYTLRDAQDRYSICGVATRELTDSIWIFADGEWQMCETGDLGPPAPAPATDIPTPDGETLALLAKAEEQHPTRGCTRQLAQALGIKQTKYGRLLHPGILSFHTEFLKPSELANAGITPSWAGPYFLDVLEFTVAATLLRTHPNLLENRNEHQCPCGKAPQRR